MILTLRRDTFLPTRTLGLLSIDGKPFGFTVEDRDRGLDSANPSTLAAKVKRETAIPVGAYVLDVRYSPKHQRDVLWLRDVPAYQYVEIHEGNTEADTEGCILPGLARTVGGVQRSRLAVAWLEKNVLPEARAGRVRILVEREASAWAAFGARAA